MIASQGFFFYNEYQVLHDILKLQIANDIKKNSFYSKIDA